MKKFFITSAVIISALFIIGFVVKKETKPSDNTRIILEHTYSTYVAPSCFNDADVTNFLEDSSLGTAIQMEYNPHDKCTEEAVKPVKEGLFISVLKDIGFIQKEWDKW